VRIHIEIGGNGHKPPDKSPPPPAKRPPGKKCPAATYSIAAVAGNWTILVIIIIIIITSSPIDRGTEYCFWSISLFVCMYLSFFVSLLARLRGVTWLHFWSIPRNRAMLRCATRGWGLLCFRTTACYYYYLWNMFFSSKLIRVRPVPQNQCIGMLETKTFTGQNFRSCGLTNIVVGTSFTYFLTGGRVLTWKVGDWGLSKLWRSGVSLDWSVDFKRQLKKF